MLKSFARDFGLVILSIAETIAELACIAAFLIFIAAIASIGISH